MKINASNLTTMKTKDRFRKFSLNLSFDSFCSLGK